MPPGGRSFFEAWTSGVFIAGTIARSGHRHQGTIGDIDDSLSLFGKGEQPLTRIVEPFEEAVTFRERRTGAWGGHHGGL